jgi:hypothetical protein
MPTDPQNVDASPADGTTPPADPSTQDDPIRSHPLYKELEEKHSAARKGLDDKAKELKRIKTALLNDEPVSPAPTAPKSDAQKMKEDIVWEMRNEEKISLASKEYESYVADGIPRDKALKLALLDKGITDDKSLSEHLRQQASSAPPSGVNRDGGAPLEGETPAERAERLQMGVSDAVAKKWEKTIAAHKRKWVGFR